MVFTLLYVAAGAGAATVFCIELTRALSSLTRNARLARAQSHQARQG